MSNSHNVIVVTFPDSSKAYQALSILKRANAEERVIVRSAALLERGADGEIHVPEGGDNMLGLGLAGGSLIGMLVGVLGGPIGMLLGLGTGAIAGGVADVYRADRGDDVLTQMGSELQIGQTALIAEVEEYALEVIDNEMATLGGSIARHPAEEVLAALDASDEAARATEKEARRVMRAERLKTVKQKLGARG